MAESSIYFSQFLTLTCDDQRVPRGHCYILCVFNFVASVIIFYNDNFNLSVCYFIITWLWNTNIYLWPRLASKSKMLVHNSILYGQKCVIVLVPGHRVSRRLNFNRCPWQKILRGHRCLHLERAPPSGVRFSSQKVAEKQLLVQVS